MKLRHFLLMLCPTMALYVLPATAHDPKDHDHAEHTTALPIPKDCDQLKDTEHYSNDQSNADIAALKKRCDAEEAGTVESTEKPLQPDAEPEDQKQQTSVEARSGAARLFA